ncbi:MAG: prolyl-tRNA synthetase associated domain-containing protein [Longimicrobiales bacterium]|nr:prolyl-tRNA synthetase associated domain-containing protein [Longimicrobiales bacterium]
MEPRLADGTPPRTPEDLLRQLEALGIPHTTRTHPPVRTVEEAREKRGPIPGAHSKNLFVRDKKGAMWIVSCLESRNVDLKALAPRIGARQRLSFGSERRLMTYLGIRPGAVSPLAVVNDVTGAVRVVLDRALLDDPPVNFHPLDNRMTTSLAPADLMRFLEAAAHPPLVLELEF